MQKFPGISIALLVVLSSTIHFEEQNYKHESSELTFFGSEVDEDNCENVTKDEEDPYFVDKYLSLIHI